MNVRRLAAIDMYGSRGSMRRRRIIVVEFLVVLALAAALSGWLLIRASRPSVWVVALWVLGVGLNYAPLSVYAVLLTVRVPWIPNWQALTSVQSCAATASFSSGFSCRCRSSFSRSGTS